jgi:NTP pyrophosphatase (non-canonical NTP hydrolase)
LPATDSSILPPPTDVLVLNWLTTAIHETAVSKGFWKFTATDPAEIAAIKIALIHSEPSEALEEARMEGELDTAKFTEELADCVIRCMDLAGQYTNDFGQVIIDKVAKNRERPYKHGKRL